MRQPRARLVLCAAIAVNVAVGAVPAVAQITTNPYRAIYGWEKLPKGREALGVVAGIYADPDKKHLWMLTRCAGNANACLKSKDDPVLKFDMDGNVVKSFGAGMFVWPHGFFVDHEGNVWVTEGAPAGEARGAEGHKVGKGHQVFKFSPEGKVLMTLGEAGVPGDDQTHFNGPSHVLVAPNGDIWVTDGHRGGNNRLVKFDKNGKYLMQVGGGVKSATMERGPLRTTSGNEGANNPGYESGIRIGDARTGWITEFVPETVLTTRDGRTRGANMEFIGLDPQGNIYAGEVESQRLVKWVRVRK